MYISIYIRFFLHLVKVCAFALVITGNASSHVLVLLALPQCWQHAQASVQTDVDPCAQAAIADPQLRRRKALVPSLAAGAPMRQTTSALWSCSSCSAPPRPASAFVSLFSSSSAFRCMLVLQTFCLSVVGWEIYAYGETDRHIER